jgi:hypothetical protein
LGGLGGSAGGVGVDAVASALLLLLLPDEEPKDDEEEWWNSSLIGVEELAGAAEAVSDLVLSTAATAGEDVAAADAAAGVATVGEVAPDAAVEGEGILHCAKFD